jgi:hypothetical protein
MSNRVSDIRSNVVAAPGTLEWNESTPTLAVVEDRASNTVHVEQQPSEKRLSESGTTVVSGSVDRVAGFEETRPIQGGAGLDAVLRTGRRKVEPILKTAVIKVFLEGGTVTKLGLARACGYEGKAAEGSNGAYNCLQRWADRGSLKLQPPTTGPGFSPHVFDFRIDRTREVTLADIVEPYLASSVDWLRQEIRSALRVAFRLPTKAGDALILERCREVPAGRLHGFPQHVYDLSRDRGLARKTAENHRGAVRRALQYAFTHDLAPMVFPEFRATDRWLRTEMQFFPRAIHEDGAHPCPIPLSRRNGLRTAWRYYREGAELAFAKDPDLLEGASDPARVTKVMLRAVRKQLIQNGTRARWRAVSSMFNQIATHDGVGPGRSNGRINPVYLQTPPGFSARRVDGFLRVFEYNGLPRHEWRRFAAWYLHWQLLPWRELRRRRKRFPYRRRGQPLKMRTLLQHMNALRAFIGVAIHRCGLDPATLTPEQVFCVHYETILNELLDYWGERAKAGELTAEATGALREIVIKSGLWAYGMFRLLGHRDHQQFEQLPGAGRKGSAALNRREARLPMSEMQEHAHRAYELSREIAENLESDLKRIGTSPTVNTQKDIVIQWRWAPPAFWERVRLRLLEEVEERRHHKGDDYYNVVLVAVILCALISTGCRQSELTHIRYGIQFDRARRVIALRDVDRKNGRHTVKLWAGVFPDWLLELYEGEVRPALLSRRTEGPHDWFLMDTRGEPFGCPEEDPNGESRDEIRHVDRINSMGRLFQDHVIRVAASLQIELHPEFGIYSGHNIRAVHGNAIYQEIGETAAANYTGDDPATLRDTYTLLSGELVNVEKLGFATPRGDLGWASDLKITIPSPSLCSSVSARESETTEASETEFDFLMGRREEFDREADLLELTPDERSRCWREQKERAQVEWTARTQALRAS